MALVDLWKHSKEELAEKSVQQLIAIAGEGKLLDGSSTAVEFREFLSIVPSAQLLAYANQCLVSSFADSGLALQDIVNQVGSRIGFSVENGRYRGTQNQIGHDGLWQASGGHCFVVEVKTTDAYRMDLSKVAGYRRTLIKEERAAEESSSVLIVVGRKDTGGLEAQIRGSRHAWDIRLISVDSLMQLMLVKESVEDPGIIKRIQDLLAPREFTRLDEIVELVFSTAEDIQDEAQLEDIAHADDGPKVPKFTPVAFHKACIDRVSSHLSTALVKRTRSSYISNDGSVAVICLISREHLRSGPKYWYAFQPHQEEFLQKREQAYVAFGCGSAESTLLVPADTFLPLLEGMNITDTGDRMYWHVHIVHKNQKYLLKRKSGAKDIDLTQFLMK